MKKMISLLLMVSLVAASVCSCSRSDRDGASRKGKVISADDPWYDGKEVFFDTEYYDNVGYGEEDYSYVSSSIVGMIGDDWLIHLEASPAYGNGEENIDLLELYNVEGELIESFDAGKVFYDHQGEYRDGFYTQGIVIYDDRIEYTMNCGLKITVSPDLKSMTDCEILPEDSAEWMCFVGKACFDDLTVDRYVVYDQTNSTVIDITHEDGTTVRCDFREQLPYEYVEPVATVPIHSNGNTKVLLISDRSFYEIDPFTGRAQAVDASEFDWLSSYDISLIKWVDGQGAILIDDDGINKIDFDNESVSRIISFDDTNINRSHATTMQLYYLDDSTVLIGTANEYIAAMSDRPSVIRLDKCDNNPHAGKTVLRAGGVMQDVFYDAIVDFNNADDDYFIVVDTRYDVREFLNMPADTEFEDYDSYYNDAYRSLTDKLAIDIMSGEGPDLFFGANSYPQLQSSDLLIDMRDRLSPGDGDDLWENVLDASESSDGHLYCVPLSFAFSAILTSNTDYGNEVHGMTLEDYDRFMREVLNGSNILSNDRVGSILALLPSVIDRCVRDGEVDFGCDEFIDICRYICENIHDVSWDVYVMNNNSPDYISSIGALLDYCSYKNIDPTAVNVIAMPSYGGDSFTISDNSDSISVASSATDIEGCTRFVNYLLSYDFQMRYGRGWNESDDRGVNLINVRAFEDTAIEAIGAYNDKCDYYYDMMGESAQYSGVQNVKVDDTYLDKYEELIMCISGNDAVDISIEIIISEEIQAYFEGQKTLDEVIDIINNRVQLVLDER